MIGAALSLLLLTQAPGPADGADKLEEAPDADLGETPDEAAPEEASADAADERWVPLPPPPQDEPIPDPSPAPESPPAAGPPPDAAAPLPPPTRDDPMPSSAPAPAAPPGPDPAVDWARVEKAAAEPASTWDRLFPFGMNDTLDVSIDDSWLLVWAMSALFAELGGGIWFPIIIGDGAPEGFVTEALTGTTLHLLSTLLCPPLLVPANVLWLIPVFSINTYSRLRAQERLATRPPPPPPTLSPSAQRY